MSKMKRRPSRLSLAIATLLFTAPLRGAEPIIVSGGMSPSKQFAVAIYVDKPADELADEEETTVYLIDARTRKKIGPLEEIDSGGGRWGTTSSNVRADWSADSQWLAVTYRAGRMIHGFVLYEISGRRAIPVTFSDNPSLPKSKVFDHLGTSVNAGSTFSGWKSENQFTVFLYGFRPKENDDDFDLSKFGLGDFDGELEEVYQLSKDRKWILKDIRVPKTRNP